jgi:hypothetical protein
MEHARHLLCGYSASANPSNGHMHILQHAHAQMPSSLWTVIVGNLLPVFLESATPQGDSTAQVA